MSCNLEKRIESQTFLDDSRWRAHLCIFATLFIQWDYHTFPTYFSIFFTYFIFSMYFYIIFPMFLHYSHISSHKSQGGGKGKPWIISCPHLYWRLTPCFSRLEGSFMHISASLPRILFASTSPTPWWRHIRGNVCGTWKHSWSWDPWPKSEFSSPPPPL